MGQIFKKKKKGNGQRMIHCFSSDFSSASSLASLTERASSFSATFSALSFLPGPAKTGKCSKTPEKSSCEPHCSQHSPVQDQPTHHPLLAPDRLKKAPQDAGGTHWVAQWWHLLTQAPSDPEEHKTEFFEKVRNILDSKKLLWLSSLPKTEHKHYEVKASKESGCVPRQLHCLW